MTTIQDHPYTNSDAEYREICRFLDELTRQDPLCIWESGRMNFWRYSVHAEKAPTDPFFAENAHVWLTESEGIVGLAISEYGMNDLFIEALPAYRDAVCPSIFDWIERAWAKARDAVEIDVFGDDAEKIRRLEEHGFVFDRHFENKRIYDLDEMDLAYTLEDGFTIRTFAQVPDVEGRVALVRSAFRNPNYSKERLRGLISSPDHVDDYDLMVISAEGRPVAYCVGWRDKAKAGHGCVEPVGTHADYRRRGFAKAVVRECLARLKRDGIRTTDIASRAEPDVANFLYESLMPKAKQEVHRYRRVFA